MLTSQSHSSKGLLPAAHRDDVAGGVNPDDLSVLTPKYECIVVAAAMPQPGHHLENGVEVAPAVRVVRVMAGRGVDWFVCTPSSNVTTNRLQAVTTTGVV